MRIGVPKEIKNHEYRVGLTPAGAYALVQAGHTVYVQRNAGARVGFPDDAYAAAGAELTDDAAAAFAAADMVIKVKELQGAEFALVRPGQILFCYQHLAPDENLLQHMLDTGASCVAYETVFDARGNLPLLAPMSRIAGRLAPQVGAWALQMANGGSGVLLGGVAGVAPARVLVIGGGTVGTNATQIAVGMGAQVTVCDAHLPRLAELDTLYQGRIATAPADPHTLADLIAASDLVISAVLIPGKLAPHLIDFDLLRRMRPGSAIVDVSIDQGGVSAASRPTTHSAPTFLSEGVVHYCVANMPAAVARTATLALTQATLPYAVQLANQGLAGALRNDPGLRPGLEVHGGHVTHQGLAQDTGRPWTDPVTLLGLA